MIRALLGLGSLVVLTACDPAVVEMAFDEDGDGLLSTEEAEIGTDPNEADSDGDGVDDGSELTAGTDPLDGEHFPYDGGWAIARCDEDPVGTGKSVGDTVDDFSLVDQNDQRVKLYDFCEYAVLVTVGAFW